MIAFQPTFLILRKYQEAYEIILLSVRLCVCVSTLVRELRGGPQRKHRLQNLDETFYIRFV
jgi:hypothetical protein